VLAVVELARLLMPRHRHVRTLYPILIPTIVVIAVTTSVASGVDLWITGSTVRVMSLAIRFSASILAITCVLLALFGKIFTEPLARNTVRHALILSGYFTTLAIGHLVLHLTARFGFASTLLLADAPRLALLTHLRFAVQLRERRLLLASQG